MGLGMRASVGEAPARRTLAARVRAAAARERM